MVTLPLKTMFFNVSIKYTGAPYMGLCVKILQILFQLEQCWFWIEGNGRF
jgi:hypothetical protein